MVAPVSVDAIVLLGCRIEADGRPSDAGLRRAQAAFYAWQRGMAPVVVVSGGRRWHGVSEAEALGAELERLGVPPDVILPELLSLSTVENARYVARMIAARGAASVAIVTCDWHLPRALASFRRLGLRAVGVPAPSPPVAMPQWLRRSVTEALSSVVDRAVRARWSAP